MPVRRVLALFVLTLTFAGSGVPFAGAANAAARKAAAAPDAEARAGAGAEEVAVLDTPLGRIVWRFFGAEAPGHVAFVKELIRRGFYDGTTFHRVIPRFVVQGGDPNSKNAIRADDGEGEAERRLKAEFSQTLHYRPGTVGMARGSDPDSGSCQFFIAIDDVPRLDGRYTIFAEVIEGLEVARRIAEVPRDLNDNPLVSVPVLVRLEKRSVAVPLAAALSRTPAPRSGEVLTGPGKPRFYDAKSPAWGPPKISGASAPSGPDAPAYAKGVPRLDVAVDESGRVVDVRLEKTDVPLDVAATARRAPFGWTFRPATLRGTPVKARFAIDADGRNIGPSSGGPGAPLEVAGDVRGPRPVVRVEVPAGTERPEEPARLRLLVDATGAVADAALLPPSDSGVPVPPALAALAESAAKRLAFTPAERPGWSEPEPVASYLEVEVRFEASAPEKSSEPVR